jgi:hypothetical protein
MTKNTNKLRNVRRPYHFRYIRPVTLPNVKFVITFKKQHNIFNTHYTISRYINYRFTIDHRNIVWRCKVDTSLMPIMDAYAPSSWMRDGLLFLQPQFTPQRIPPQQLLWAGSRAARVKFIIRGTPNGLNCHKIVIVCILFTKRAASSVAQPGRPQAEHPWYTVSVPATGIITIHAASVPTWDITFGRCDGLS